jgi:endonuclease YncB( thermonuclease family)
MPVVEFDGSIDLSQFWPAGKSDADTSKLVVDLKSGIRVRQSPAEKALPTKVYNTAYARVNGQKKPLINASNQVVVRLQGLDAPELHARPRPMKGPDGKPWSLAGLGLVKDYRQAQGETATVILSGFLNKHTNTNGVVSCQFVTYLRPGEGPASAIDMFGRFVGNIEIKKSVLNLWLLKNGVALPAIYSGMDLDNETTPVLEAWASGRTKGIVPYYARAFGTFSPTRIYRAKAWPEPEKAKFVHPKFFRRQVSWYAYSKAKFFKGTFAAFLKTSTEQVMLLDDYLDGQDSAQVLAIHDPKIMNASGLVIDPEKVVFKESRSQIFRKSGTPIVDW